MRMVKSRFILLKRLTTKLLDIQKEGAHAGY